MLTFHAVGGRVPGGNAEQQGDVGGDVGGGIIVNSEPNEAEDNNNGNNNSEPGQQQAGGENGNRNTNTEGNGFLGVLRVIGTVVAGIIAFGGLGLGMYFAIKRLLGFFGKNIIIYQMKTSGGYSLLTKAKLTAKMDYLDMNLLPASILQKISTTETRAEPAEATEAEAAETETKGNGFMIELTPSARKKFEGEEIAVKFRDEVVKEYVDPDSDMKRYQFEVYFR